MVGRFDSSWVLYNDVVASKLILNKLKLPFSLEVGSPTKLGGGSLLLPHEQICWNIESEMGGTTFRYRKCPLTILRFLAVFEETFLGLEVQS